MAKAKTTKAKAKKPTKATAKKPTKAKAAPKAAKAPKTSKASKAPRAPAKKPVAAPAPAAPEAPPGELVGEVTHYFNGISVAAIQLTGTLVVGDNIAIRRAEGYLEQSVDSMQIERKDVPSANAGDEIGIKVSDKVHEHNKVYKV